MLCILEERARISGTAKLWINCLVQPVLIMMLLFIRAEREAEWPLHLLAVKLMMPYFFAGGHLNYARYGLYDLSLMERLPDDILVQFMKGEHVMRHQAGIWNGMWSDMFKDYFYALWAWTRGPCRYHAECCSHEAMGT